MVALWQKHLASFPDKGIEYAFDNWNRNAKFFPKPADITELVTVWRNAQKPAYSAHDYQHTGFGQVQVLALWKLFHRKYPDFKRGDRLTGEQWQEMINEVSNPEKTSDGDTTFTT